MKVLNLYAGLGGNRKLWDECQVTSVENEPKIAAVYQRLHPADTVIVGDAHQYLLDHYEEFDFVWTSPPCQTHSKMAKATRHKLRRYTDMSLYQEILFLQNFFKGQFVVENVVPYYEPLIVPTKRIGRHLFWSNFEFEAEEVKQPMDVTFRNGGHYRYFDVPAELYQSAIAAESIGSFMAKQIKGRYRYAQVNGD